MANYGERVDSDRNKIAAKKEKLQKIAKEKSISIEEKLFPILEENVGGLESEFSDTESKIKELKNKIQRAKTINMVSVVVSVMAGVIVAIMSHNFLATLITIVVVFSILASFNY